ncbi:MAG TPA: thiamine pyrophosphate-dependent enzyme [Clostridia bacterium]|nr:thiamine pyrophosphate-dependent enzyme [Clostridia bacterium]HPQ47821.1 thiamine pyrophosphate-dependent enzyme [Clostridia bacterium]HRX43542.1 thiamine pyrophosphate-dependent enzyme [Clostridia bacterium]
MPKRLHPNSLERDTMHYCPGCSHGIAHRVIAEVIDELGLEGSTIGISPVGCSYNNYKYFTFDMLQAAHGRAPAVATGVKRVHPDKTVFTYQGDGDLAAIGTAEIIHAAARGEKITTIFINNAIYGMTSGQMAPTTLEGQVTTTSPLGRDHRLQGFPLKMSEILAQIDGAVYIERVSMHDVNHILKAKRAIKKAFKVQMEGLGFSMIEVLSTCPTNWRMKPVDASAWVRDTMMEYYKLGVYKGGELEV